jgi:hypothetical protein
MSIELAVTVVREVAVANGTRSKGQTVKKRKVSRRRGSRRRKTNLYFQNYFIVLLVLRISHNVIKTCDIHLSVHICEIKFCD